MHLVYYFIMPLCVAHEKKSEEIGGTRDRGQTGLLPILPPKNGDQTRRSLLFARGNIRSVLGFYSPVFSVDSQTHRRGLVRFEPTQSVG
jgi:hypothetical protein